MYNLTLKQKPSLGDGFCLVDHETENPILVRQKKRGRDDDDIVRLRAFIVKLYQTFKDVI